MQSMIVAVLLASCLATALAAPADPHHGEEQDNHVSGSVGASHSKGVGTAVHVHGQGDVWRSRDGSARVNAEGHYDQVVHGPASGSRDYGAVVTYELKI